MEHRGKAVPRVPATSPESALASELFDQFVSAATFKSVLTTNRQLCDLLRLKPTAITNFYPRLKAKLHSWRAASLWTKLDKRSSHKCYNRGKACPNTRVLIIGAGPCGLRTAIEAQLLGAKVVVVEKRDRFSRNNVLHLWPFVIHDLRNLGAKKFFGKFCAGSIDHISIRQLQIILLKVALLLGVEVHENVGFESLVEPPDDQHERIGWHAHVSPVDHPVSQYEFDVLIGADGKRNTLLGFNRKEFRGKLAIAVTANFINRHTLEEARVPEISGVAFIFNQKFFQDMKEQTAIDLENIVYYKDDTHYFVMTAKKQSLLERGVIIQDFNDTARLLSPENVDREALMEYARDAADFATSYQLPHQDFAVNHYGQADVAMFDFTSMYAAVNACRVLERREHKLLQGLVGDSLLEPFWPTGSGCARGFLSAFDAAWMIRSWASGKLSTLQVLSEREAIYRLLAQTTPENLSKDLNQYTLNPSSRYPNLNLHAVLPSQVRSLFDTDGKVEETILDVAVDMPKRKRRKESMIHPDTLLNWCQKQVVLNDKVKITDFTSSWKNGLALCTILHHYRPDLIDISALDPENITKNNQLAFDICERELGIPPVMTGLEMAECAVPDKLAMVSYISQVYESFRGEIPVVSRPKSNTGDERIASPSKQFHTTPLSILNKVSNRLQGKRKYSIEKEMAKDKERGENVRKRSSLLIHKRKSKERDKSQDIILTDYKINDANKPRESINTRVKNLEEQMKKDAGLRCHLLDQSENIRTAHQKTEPSELNIKLLQQQLQNNGNDASVNKARVPKVGKLRKDEWNVKVFEEKNKQRNIRPKTVNPEKPRIFQEIFVSKLHQMDEKLKAGGTLTPDEEARYKKFDASLNKLKDRLSKGSLDVGDRGHNQTAAMTEHMAKILEKKADRTRHPPPLHVLKVTADQEAHKNSLGSTVCYFCKERVYLMEHLSAEGLFFHRSCFKCSYCSASLRLGDYAFDREAEGKFYCIPHFRMQKTDLRQQEMMKRKQAFLSCALEKQEKERLYQILLDNTEKALSPKRENTSPTVTDGPIPLHQVPKTEFQISPSNLLAEPASMIGRDQTPERVEYENSIIEMSEDELLTSELEEEELTQKNLGPSQDLATSEDDYSDLSTDSESDEEAFAEELERSLTADETRKLAETWNRKYSTEHSLVYNSLSSSADDEGSDTEVGSDDTSHDIDSDAEYSIENSEEDGVQACKEPESPGISKTPEEKEFTMEVPVIDLKAINRVSEDETTSESDISEDGNGNEDISDDETGTEVESESDSAPLPPPQIPTIVIYESPPQNTDLEQEWNNNTSKTNAQTPDKTIVLSSDSSVLNSSNEQMEDSIIELEPVTANAQIVMPIDCKNDDGKLNQLSDMDKNLNPSSSSLEPILIEDEKLYGNKSAQFIAPLATGESSSDVSLSSDIDSLAKEIVNDVLKAAQDSITEKHLSTECQELDHSQDLEQNLENIEVDAAFCSTPYSKVLKETVIDLVTPEDVSKNNKTHDIKPSVIEEINLCTPPPAQAIDELFTSPPHLEAKITKENQLELSKLLQCASRAEKAVTSKNNGPKSTLLNNNVELETNETVTLANSNDLSMQDDYLTGSSDPLNETSFITIRKKKNATKNESSYDWECDKSLPSPVNYFQDDDSLPVGIFQKKEDSFGEIKQNNTDLKHDHSCLPEISKLEESDWNHSDEQKVVNSCLSQSLPNSSFMMNTPNSENVSYILNKSGQSKLGKLSEPSSPIKLNSEILSKSLIEPKLSPTLDIMTRSDSAALRSSDVSLTPELNSSKENSKYKGYSGSFAEKVRPKSLFCDAIYLRSLDIKLQKQPFPSLNKGEDKLDDCCKSEDEDVIRKKLFVENNKNVDMNVPDSSLADSNFNTPKVNISSTCLKQKSSFDKSDKISNLNTNKRNTGDYKHPSVSFSAPESYSDLVSPYTCVQMRTTQDTNFPTNVKPKCEVDLAKLRQKREKRKSVHEDIQGVPFADEDKIVSPVDPVASSDVFESPKEANVRFEFGESPVTKTPDLIDEERYLRMQSSIEQEKARQEARARARLKSDEELGLSPNNYRKKYRRQLSLNSINYDELCSDEFCDQDYELEDDVITSFCQSENLGLDQTFNMLKNSDILSKGRTPTVSSDVSSQKMSEIKILPPPPDYDPYESTDSLEKTPQAKHSSITSSPETSPDVCASEPSLDSRQQTQTTKSKSSLVDGLGEDEKSKSNGKKSIFSILNFGKSNPSKEKLKQKSKEKDLSSSLPNDIGSRSNAKTKTFSNLKLSKSKDKYGKLKAKSVPPESIPASPVERAPPIQEETTNFLFSTQQAKIIPKYTVYRNPDTTISSFPVHLPVPKMENGLAPKASEDSFSDEEDTQGSKAGQIPTTEKTDKEKKTQRIVQKVQRQQVLKRLRNAQEIQRRLEELEIQQKELEQQGVELEKLLRGEQHRLGCGKGEAELMQEWYTLIHTKNQITREVQDLLIRLKDLELEDRHSRLQQEITRRMAEGSRKNATQLIEERKILDEMLKIVDQRNELVAVLEQLRLREREEEMAIGSKCLQK